MHKFILTIYITKSSHTKYRKIHHPWEPNLPLSSLARYENPPPSLLNRPHQASSAPPTPSPTNLPPNPLPPTDHPAKRGPNPARVFLIPPYHA